MKHRRTDTIRFKAVTYFVSVSFFSFFILGFIYVESYGKNLKHDLKVTLDLLNDEIIDHRYYRMEIEIIKEFLHLDDYYIKEGTTANISNLEIRIEEHPYVSDSGDEVIYSTREVEGGKYLTMLSDTKKIAVKTGELSFTLFSVFSLVLLLSSSIFIFYLYKLFKPLDCLIHFCKNFTNDRSLLPTCSGSGEISDLKDAILELLDTNSCLIEQERDVFKEAAHEIKTPLAVLKARISLYEDGEYDKESFLQDANKDINKITQHLKELLFIKSVERVLMGNNEQMDLYNEIEVLIEQFRPLLAKKSLQIFFGNKFTFKVDINKKALHKIIKAIAENMISYAQIGSVIYININPANKSISFINKIGNKENREMFSSQIGLKIIGHLSEKLKFTFHTKEDGEKFTTTLVFNQ